MRRLTLRRPSPALVISVIALVISMGGTGIAASTLINGKNIKKNTIPGNRLKADGVTGGQVKESSLGKVPSAAKADTATSASIAVNATNANNAAQATNATNATHAVTADTVGGVSLRQFSVRLANDGAETTLLDANGVKLSLTCPAGKPTLKATNTSGANNTMIRGTFVASTGASTTGSSNFDIGEVITLWDGTSDSRGTVTLANAREGAPSMMLTIALDDATTYGDFVGCAAVGSATIG